MDRRKTKINRKINAFLEEFKKVAPLKRAILFGSYARGTAHKWSDIDLAIISQTFDRMDNFQRLVMLGKLAWKVKSPEIEALGFTPKEYKEVSKLDLLGEIKSSGIPISISSRKN